MPHSEKGSAIIIALIISIIAMSLTLFSVSISKKIVSSCDMLMDKLRSKLGVESEIEKLKFYISTGRFYYSYIENRNNIGLPRKIYIDGRTQRIDNGSIINIKDAGGLIDVWAPNMEMIKLLLERDNVSVFRASVVIDSIRDWCDSDNFRRPYGAEAAYYKSRGYKYVPRNFSAVQSIYEWRIIRGLGGRVFDVLKDYLILSPEWHPNINTMDENMLSAFLNIPLPLAKALIRLRRVKGFLSSDDLKKVLGADYDITGYYAFPTFVLDISAKFRFNEAVDKVSCVISFRPDNSTPYRVLKWQN